MIPIIPLKTYVREVEDPVVAVGKSDLNRVKSLLFEDVKDSKVIFTSSGKAAIHIILSYYRSIEKIKDQDSELLVPRWIGSWVYSVMQKTCTPSMSPSKNTRGVFLYHQYGHPQRLDILLETAKENGWFVIEDCAHSIQSYFQGQRVGSLGDASVFSFSKFFPTLMGGAIVTKNPGLAVFAEKYINAHHSSTIQIFSLFSKWAYLKYRDTEFTLFNKLLDMSYNVYELTAGVDSLSALGLLKALLAKSIERRNENRDFFLEHLKARNCFLDIDYSQITPYILPYFAPVDRLETLVSQLKKQGVLTGIYRFDTNFNLLSPNFKPCLWLPVHPGIDDQIRERILKCLS